MRERHGNAKWCLRCEERTDERSPSGKVRGTEGGSRMTPWHKATRVELVAEIDRLTRINAELRAELALRTRRTAQRWSWGSISSVPHSATRLKP